MQQGDNGQSLVLGGRDPEGKYLFNDLSRMCLQASYELKLIDPKINIRVDPKTPDEIFTLGSRLTKIGLGFPNTAMMISSFRDLYGKAIPKKTHTIT